jgi:hypothetical protein
MVGPVFLSESGSESSATALSDPHPDVSFGTYPAYAGPGVAFF